jgi:hypothetical protein
MVKDLNDKSQSEPSQTARAASSWDSVKFPGAANEAQLKQSFLVLNHWALALQEWEKRIRAMCGIMEATLNLSEGQFESVLMSIKDEKHSKEDIRSAINAGSGGGGVVGAVDVAGHPPDPPFLEPFT